MIKKRYLTTVGYVFIGALSALATQYLSTEGIDNLQRTQLDFNDMENQNSTFVQIVKINSSLSEKEFVEKAQTRAEQFRAMSGLVQKYYVKLSENGDYGGIYIWDSRESFLEYKKTDLAKTIGEAYELTASPSVELGNLLFLLRE